MYALKHAYPQLPDRIDTDVGICTLGLARAKSSRGRYLCPLCDEYIEPAEQHVVAVPVKKESLRRHLHGECLVEHLKYGVTIKLHPNEPYASKLVE